MKLAEWIVCGIILIICVIVIIIALTWIYEILKWDNPTIEEIPNWFRRMFA